MRRKLLFLSVILVFLFHCFGKGFDAACVGTVPAGILESQPITQFSSLLCMVPIKIVNSLIGSKAWNGTSTQRKGQKENKPDTRNASSAFSLLASVSVPMVNGLKLISCGTPVCLLRVVDTTRAAIGAAHHPPGPPLAIFLFMMMLFVVLPKTGASESAVFYCLKN